MNLKQELFNQCEAFVNNRLHNIENVISSNQKALASETKSSAGDKHETGRAMLQLEMEKAGQQLSSINKMKEILNRIDVSNSETSEPRNAHLGSVIFTSKMNYFLSISAGQLAIAGKHYFAISSASPIGRLLLGKQENETIIFNGKTIKINEIL